jgi:hypothetical protein
MKTKTTNLLTDSMPAAKSTFAIGGGSCSADSLVVAESFVLRINICAEKPAHRKPNRAGLSGAGLAQRNLCQRLY